jgi:ribose transport system substrate-binding protein
MGVSLKKDMGMGLVKVLSLAFFAVAATGVAISNAEAACTPHKVDLGGGKSVQSDCSPMKLAFLSLGTNNVYLQAGIKGFQDAAKEGGAAKAEVFDAGWNNTTQYNQAQNVVSGGQFNGIVAEMGNGIQVCKLLSEDAVAKGIIVSAANQPLCDRATKEGEDYWSPGTLNYVGGTQGGDAWREALEYVIKENPGPQKVAVVTGPDLIVQTIMIDKAIKEMEAKYPNFKVVAEVRTDYSLPQAYQKSLPLLQAHPELTMLIGNYSDLTRGAVQAIKEAGLTGKLKVYDNGGSTWAFQAVRDGDVVSTRTYTPYDEMYKSAKSIIDAWNGTTTSPHYVPLVSAYVTKANIDQNKPQY